MTKCAHFCPISYPFKAITLDEEFMEKVQKLPGIPKIIVNYRDPILD